MTYDDSNWSLLLLEASKYSLGHLIASTFVDNTVSSTIIANKSPKNTFKVWDKGSGLADAITEERKGFNEGDYKNMKDM